MTAATTEAPAGPIKADRSTSGEQEQLNQFAGWFSRCGETLHFTAGLILGAPEMAERAVRNCRIRASRNPPSFESEGSFRSWILRILIAESLSILHPSPAAAPGK
jgi:DNA-directed RNA polymerase specialized sigma24 family protein